MLHILNTALKKLDVLWKFPSAVYFTVHLHCRHCGLYSSSSFSSPCASLSSSSPATSAILRLWPLSHLTELLCLFELSGRRRERVLCWCWWKRLEKRTAVSGTNISMPCCWCCSKHWAIMMYVYIQLGFHSGEVRCRWLEVKGTEVKCQIRGYGTHLPCWLSLRALEGPLVILYSLHCQLSGYSEAARSAVNCPCSQFSFSVTSVGAVDATLARTVNRCGVSHRLNTVLLSI